MTIEKPRSRTLDETEYTEDVASIEDDALRSVREEIVIPKAPNTGKR